TITGNTMWKGYTHNLLLTGCDSLVVTGNLLDDNPRYHYGDGSDAKLAVVIENCTDSLFSGNLIKGTHRTDAAVTLAGCRWTTIEGCQILDYDGWGLTLKDCEQCRVINSTVADRRAEDPTA